MSPNTENSEPSESSKPPVAIYSHRLVVLAVLSCVATFLVATLYPSGRPADELSDLSFGETYGWVLGQAFLLTIPGIIVGVLVGAFLPRLGEALGAAMVLVVPLVVLCDAIAFTWVAERFLSTTMQRIGGTLLPSLLLYVTWPMVLEAVLTVLGGLALFLVVWWISGGVGRWWSRREGAVQPVAASGVLLSLTMVVSLPAVWNYERTLSEMANASTRHPFCAFRIVGFRGVGVSSPTGRAETIARLRGLQAVPAVQQRDQQQAAVQVDQQALGDASKRKKVIVILVECLRTEVIDPAVMPNLHAFAEKSIFCRQNFSGGNATCYGMFAFVNGLEAVWFRRPIRNEPIMNRLLRAAGYEIGFYGAGGSQTDWKHFNMEGFIAPQHYDDFRLEATKLPQSDIQTVQRALEFINAGERAENDADSGRMSIAYMFATHRRFSEPQDRIFQPAAEQDSMLRSPESKALFYNRYKNSARTVDRLIKPLLRDDCVVIVLGDHGEPIMDDGTSGHGTRLSRFQNMTPAIVHFPGVVPRKIDFPTCHADLLPTLLSVLDIPVTDVEVFDGVDLTTAEEEALSTRSFVSRNYLNGTSLLVGPWTIDPSQPFGYRVVYSIDNWQSSYLNPIDELGFQWERDDPFGKQRFLDWVRERFGDEAVRESGTERELFESFFASPDRETRLSVLKIAGETSNPDDYLYDLIAQATRDEDAEIRDLAKELVIRVNRTSGQD